jgi:hypothetical protein
VYVIKYIIALVTFLPLLTRAQDSLWKAKPEVKLTGFVDVFYMYDFAKPDGNQRQPFFYNYNRHNEFNLNLGLIKISVEHAKYRANLAFHSGTYSNDNYAQEPGLLKNIFEANVGVSLNRKNNLWFDMGVLPSHIGFETAVSLDNWTLTRSILADNSPYFETGAKLTFSPSSKFELSGLILNGWQRIQKQKENSWPSFGTQFKYTQGPRFTFNWSTYAGPEGTDSQREWRFFNNFYGVFNIGKRLGIIGGFDIGFQQSQFNLKKFRIWLSPVLIFKVDLSKKISMACRAEYFRDKPGVIYSKFETYGFSTNLDYSPIDFIKLRAEARWLYSPDRIYSLEDKSSRHNIVLGGSVAIRISKRL